MTDWYRCPVHPVLVPHGHPWREQVLLDPVAYGVGFSADRAEHMAESIAKRLSGGRVDGCDGYSAGDTEGHAGECAECGTRVGLVPDAGELLDRDLHEWWWCRACLAAVWGDCLDCGAPDGGCDCGDRMERADEDRRATERDVAASLERGL